MRRLAVVLAVVGALSAPAAARAEEVTVRMPGKYFDPARPTAVAGDLVTFRNTDLVTHDVRIGSVFDSGPVASFARWSQAIDQPGEYPFVCTLHAFMSGNLSVVSATVAASPDGVLAGEPLTLSGRATAGSGPLGLERSTPAGGWIAVGAPVVPAADGTFSAKTLAVEGASYRVTTPAGASPAVTPRVSARVDVHVDVRRSRRHVTVRVHAMPAPAGMVATLEVYSRWHYTWRDRRHAKLDAQGRARFRLPVSRRVYARVSLRRRARGPALVRSGVVKTWNGRRAQDPDTITPPASGGHGGGEHGGDDGHGSH